MGEHHTLSPGGNKPRGGKTIFSNLNKRNGQNNRSTEKRWRGWGLNWMPQSPMTEEFHRLSKLEAHLNIIGHYSLAEQVRRGLYFTLRIDWVGRFQNISLDGKWQPRNESEVESAAATEDGLLEMGWALHKPRGGHTRFSDKVCMYLQKSLRLDLGEEGRNNLRKEQMICGKFRRMFSRTEWLSKLQIQGFFSRMSARRKQSTLKEFCRDEDDDNLTMVLPRNMHAEMMSNWRRKPAKL